HREELAVVSVRIRAAFIDDEAMSEARDGRLVRHLGEVAERVRIRERAVLRESFLKVAALRIVEPARVAAVVAREDAAFRVDLDPERVAATFGEDLVAPRLGVIAPDELAHGAHGIVAPTRTNDRGRDGAPLSGVEPTVGSPRQAVDDRV